jgi:glyoxylase-like metal-dependent hydrolase (beta-lactamase superfamily II)
MEISAYNLNTFGTNCYLVYDEKSNKACLIDPAVYDDKIAGAISSKRLSLEYIILTHGHFDHLLGANAFKESTGAKIAAHELEAEYLEDAKKNLSGSEIIYADILLKDAGILTFGDISLMTVHTPGHTKGSCCFVCGSEKVMFSGDTLFKDGIGRYDLYGGNYRTLRESLQKLKSLGQNGEDYKIYPGHGGSTTLEHEMINNSYLW